jgi:hypothetical protein
MHAALSLSAQHGIEWCRLSSVTAEKVPKPSVTLQMPFAAHGRASTVIPFGVKQYPGPTSRRFCASTGVVLVKAALEICGPSNVGSVGPSAIAPKDVNVTVHDSANVIGGMDGSIRQ